MASRPRLMFVLNVLNPGTGPFQRAARLDPARLDVTIVSAFDTQWELESKVQRLVGGSLPHRLVGLGPGGRLETTRRLWRAMSELRPDIIHVNHSFSAAVCLLLARFNGRPATVAFEGTMLSRYGRLRGMLQAWLYSRADRIISVSNAAAEVNARVGGFLAQCAERTVIYNGVDLGDLNGQEGRPCECSTNHTGLVVGYVGDLKPVKDVETLIRAFGRVARRHEDWRLMIVGGGPLEQQLRKMVAEIGLSSCVEFTGQVERAEVYRRLRDMDMFIMPSLVEGLSEAVAQALACGVPVIVSDIAPNREIIAGGACGRLFPPGDADALARQIEALGADPEGARALSKRGRRHAEECLDIGKIVQQYHALYDELVGSREHR